MKVNLFEVGVGNVVGGEEVSLPFLKRRIGHYIEIVKEDKTIRGYLHAVEDEKEKIILWISGKKVIFRRKMNVILIF